MARFNESGYAGFDECSGICTDKDLVRDQSPAIVELNYLRIEKKAFAVDDFYVELSKKILETADLVHHLNFALLH